MVRFAAWVAILTVFNLGAAMAKGDQAAGPVSLGQLNGVGVEGRLGKRLGTILTVTGTMIANESRSKADADWEGFLRIEAVDGKKLASPVQYPFCEAHSWLEVEEPKVGAAFTLVGYETGGFKGSPEGELELVPAYAATAYHFGTQFLVLVAK